MAKVEDPVFLEQCPIGRLLWHFSLPAITATMVSATYNFVARIFVGQKIGLLGITALQVSFPVMLIMLAFAMMIATGATTLISIHLGEKNKDRAEQILGQALFLNLVLSLCFICFGLTYMEPLLRLFGASDEVLPLARSYLKVIIWGVLFQQISFGVNNFIRAEGRPYIAMISMFISAIINLFLDWFFLFYLETEIWGAGLANVIALAVSSCWICWLYLSGRTILQWHIKYIRFDFKLCRAICIYGTVPLMMQACSAILGGIQNHLMGYYGTLYGEYHCLEGINGGDMAIGIAGTIFVIGMVMVMPMLGLSQGMQPIIGYNVGASRPDRVVRTLELSLITVLSIGMIFGLLVVLKPDWLLYLFINPNASAYKESMELGIKAVRIMLFTIPLVGINIIVSSYFQAHGRPILSLILTMLRQLIFLLPMVYFLPWIWTRLQWGQGLDAYWAATPISDTLACLVSLLFLFFELKNKKSYFIPSFFK